RTRARARRRMGCPGMAIPFVGQAGVQLPGVRRTLATIPVRGVIGLARGEIPRCARNDRLTTDLSFRAQRGISPLARPITPLTGIVANVRRTPGSCTPA